MKSLKTRLTVSRAATLLVLVLIFAFAGVALAADSVTLLGYQFDLLGFTDNGDNTSTWTYAVTADGDETYGLSHWTLGIGTCYDVISPADGASYTTITDHPLCLDGTYTCIESECTAVHGLDPTTGVDGIKFEDCDPQLGDNLLGTHIFQFTVDDVPIEGGDVDVAAKGGGGLEVGTITGPACGSTAVKLAGLSVTQTGAEWGTLILALAMLSLGGITGYLLYRSRTTV